MVSAPAVCSREALTHCLTDFISSQGTEPEALQTHSRPGDGFARGAGSTLTSGLLCPWGQELSASKASPLCPPAACPRPKQTVSLGKGTSRGYSQELKDGVVTANSLPPDSAVSLPRLPWGLGWVLRVTSRKGILDQRGVGRSGRAVGLLPRGLPRRAELWRPACTYTLKGFSIVNEAEEDVFLEFPCFFYEPIDIGILTSGSSAFSKSSLYIWKFSVYILLKLSLKDFEHYLASM